QYLTGEVGIEEIGLFQNGELRDLDIELLSEHRVEAVDTEARALDVSGGLKLEYDYLVLAVGAAPRKLDLGKHRRGMHYLRTRQDAEALQESLRSARNVAVIGAGFIGLEVAAAARMYGAEATVLEVASAP